MSNSPYEVLRINPESSFQEIKTAYKRLLKIYHPDVNKSSDADEVFKKIVKAYKTLVEKHDTTLPHPSESIASAKPNETNLESSLPLWKRFTFFLEKRVFQWLPNFIPSPLKPTPLQQTFEVDPKLIGLAIQDLTVRFHASENKYVRMESLKALMIKMGKRSLPFLLMGLVDISKDVRKIAIQGIGSLRIRQGIQPMLEIFPQSGVELRREILLSMIQFNLHYLLPFIVKCCFDSEQEIQIVALSSLKKQEVLLYKTHLAPLVHDQHPEIRRLAQEILANTPSKG